MRALLSLRTVLISFKKMQ